MSASVSETFHYEHPGKEGLNKTIIYHLGKKFLDTESVYNRQQIHSQRVSAGGKLLEKNERDS